ncbi:MAG: 1-acyl-sn-glycerol-3-phosphate acyltransferase [Clostridia bacterium]|nr:1-acyl-sn-glycerol-3-phosphate acyltransferase [Clostridia bacterium]
METKKANKAKLFDVRRIPQDASRLVSWVALPIFRTKKYDVNGNKYKAKLKGGAVVVSNHVGFADPFVLGATFWYRRMFFLASETVMRNPVISTLLRGVGCIKIDRNISDIEAIRKAASVLKDGRILTIFPQGGIKDAGSVAQIKAGAVLLALQTDVPIIPSYSQKTNHWWQRRRIVIGDAIDPKALCAKKMPSMADINNISATLLERIEECREQYEKITAR